MTDRAVDVNVEVGHQELVPYILHFEPSLDALPSRSDVISSIQILLFSIAISSDTSRTVDDFAY